jgi:hypothetical protein
LGNVGVVYCISAMALQWDFNSQEKTKIKLRYYRKMTEREKRNLINLGFILFAGFFFELLRAGHTGKFSITAWLIECLVIALIGWLLSKARKLFG